MIIGDITRAYPGTEQRFLSLLLARRQKQGGRAVIVLHTRQQQSFEQPDGVEPLVVSEWATPAQIAVTIREQLIAPAMATNSGEQVEIFSFHYGVLNLPGSLPFDVARQVMATPWKYLGIDGVVRDRTSRFIPALTVSDEAIDILVDLINRYPRGIQQSSLRDILAGASPLFEKSSGGPPIGAVVKAARSRGLVEAFPIGHVNPVVRPAKSTGQQQPAATTTPERVETPKTEALSSAPAEPQPAPNAETRPFEANDPGIEPNVPPQSDPIESATRVQQFYKFYRQGGLGPFPKPRPAWFEGLEKLAAEGKYFANSIIKKLARDIIASGEKLTFAVIEQFFFELMRRRPVFVDAEGQERDPQAASSFGVVIVGLIETWRDFLEAELLLYLTTMPGGVGTHEFDHIGFVMWPGLSPDSRHDRVEELFALLAAERKIRTEGGRIIPLVRCSSETPKAVADPRGPEQTEMSA